jgi:hypothetical protein
MRFRRDIGCAQQSMRDVGCGPFLNAVPDMIVVILFPVMLPLAAWLAAAYHLI